MTKTTDTRPEITMTAPEGRQIARVLHFPMAPMCLAPYINWENIAQTARELGAHFEVRYANDGACTITMFWAYTADEMTTDMSEN
jgi:hypothetical protein